MSAAWNRWFHCIGGTYGSWLPGDPRGFRTRHHREHVEGDYRNPPPAGIYEPRHRREQESLRFDAVTIRPEDRRIICQEMGRILLAYGAELIDLSVGGQHFHALCRFPLELPTSPEGGPPTMPHNLLADGRDPLGPHILGRVKRAASMAMLRLGHKPQGRPLWAKRTKLEPVTSREHQLNVVAYIRRHAHAAAIWSQLPAQ